VLDFDLFISYRWTDAEKVLPLVAVLRDRGLSVWLDQTAIDEFAPVPDEIRHGLARSKALMAWYSEAYTCQMELTAALLAAQREGDPRWRVLVINPEPAASPGAAAATQNARGSFPAQIQIRRGVAKASRRAKRLRRVVAISQRSFRFSILASVMDNRPLAAVLSVLRSGERLWMWRSALR
jgi:TIR domain-containing protein